MTRLNIFKLEDVNETKPVCTLPRGEHQIGRDGILKCSDKRISRSHAIIIITEDAVTLKSLHVNPCFYRASKGKCLQLVKKDERVSLSDGDQFSLLADSYWFRVRISSEEASEKATGSPKKEGEPAVSCLQNISRLLNTSLPTEENKIDTTRLMTNLENIVEEDFGKSTKDTSADEDSNGSMDFADLLTKDTGDHHQGEVINASGNDNTLEEENNGEEKSNYETAEESKTCKEETLSKAVSDIVDNEKANSDNETASAQVVAGASTDKPKVRRDRCWYGANCYRKNPLHRSTISHPGDDDYDSDPTDDRPVCPFGTACYRTNKDHRRDYKHSAPPSARKPAADTQSKQSPKRDESSSENEKSGSDSGKRRKRKAAKKVKKLNETPEDDYDFDDPFLNDASSDDFELSDGDDSDDTTDWEDSQAVDEESQERKRLLKEAKKFTKEKKRKKT